MYLSKYFILTTIKTAHKREISGLVKAAEMFKCENLLLINFDAEQDVEKKGHAIHIVPAAEWLSQNK